MSKPDIQFSVKTTKKGFTICDETGKYSKMNKCGWKQGDWSINNVSSSFLRVKAPSGEYLPDYDLSGKIPSLDCTCLELLPEDFMLTEFDTGKYSFEYNILFSYSGIGATIIQRNVEIYHLEKLKCCIEKKKLEVKNILDSSDVVKVYLNDILFENAVAAICKGDENCADIILGYLREQCKCKKC